MIILRSIAYFICFSCWSLSIAAVALPCLLSQNMTARAMKAWAKGLLWLAEIIINIKLEIRGSENLPKGSCIIAAQHQSAFETYMIFLVLDKPIAIMKESLKWIPLIGWYIQRGGLIGIDRKGGARSIRRILTASEAAITAERKLVIFPEGTRTNPGDYEKYKPGVVALYNHNNAPIIPMALNSGHYWGKQQLIKKPGTIIFEFLPEIPPGLSKSDFIYQLRAAIEGANSNMPTPNEVND
ncbi:MAG: 1-acyl-sn-glycerol-3-phosphate acyltransferase [Rhodospirillaceae bacterium]|nr:1-acyl-sn-glycerol-3-phosphate acyltransferase [Rhodospirillaceae bacterium]